MKYRLGMLVAVCALTATTAFAQFRVQGEPAVYLPNAAMENARSSSGAIMSRSAWLRADQSNCNAWTVWGNPVGSWTKQSRNGDYAGYYNDYYGMAVGADYNIGSNLKVGAALQYGQSEFDAKYPTSWGGGPRSNYADIDSFSAGLYAVYTFKKFFVEAGSYYLWNQYTDRSGWTTAKDFDSNGWNGTLKVGYQFNLFCDLTVTPTIGLDYIYLKNDSFGDAGFRLNKYTDTSLQMPLEVTVAKSFATNFGSLTPFVKGGWIHEFQDKGNIVDLTTSGSSTPLAKLYGQDSADDMGVVGLGLNANVNGRADIFASWDYTWGKRYYNNTFNFGAGINF